MKRVNIKCKIAHTIKPELAIDLIIKKLKNNDEKNSIGYIFLILPSLAFSNARPNQNTIFRKLK